MKTKADKLEPSAKASIHRILIIKMSSIGDVVHSLPFLEVIRSNFPHSKIDWVVEEAALEILRGHPALDRIIVSRRKTWQKNLKKGFHVFSVAREARKLYKEIRSVKYDIVIDLQGLFRSGLLVGLSRSEKKIGLSGAREGAGFFYSPVKVNYEQHAVDRYLQVAEFLGCDLSLHQDGRIPVSDRDRENVKALLSRIGPNDDRPVVAINPVARWVTKMWDINRMALLAEKLQRELSCRIVFTGSPQDKRLIENVLEHMGEKPLNLSGRTSLKELACLYSRCRLLITADTGPLHIAAAMGCRVMAIFGPTDPIRTGPYGKGHVVVQSGVDCAPCLKRSCESMKCMDLISVDQCFQMAEKMLV